MHGKLMAAFIVAAISMGRALAGSEPVELWLDEGIVLSRYSGFEVVPVANMTGKTTFEFDVASVLTEHIVSKFREFKLPLAPKAGTEKQTIVVRSELMLYSPGSVAARWVAPGWGATKCVLRTMLIDKASGELIGDFIAVENVRVGGLFSAGADKSVLEWIAKQVASAIDQSYRMPEQAK